MFGLILGIHILICFALIVVVLLQSGRGTGLAGVFGGGGGTGAVFGTQTTATFLSKATSTLAIAFMLTSLTLALLSSARVVSTRGVLSEKLRAVEQMPVPESTFEPPSIPPSAEEALLEGGAGETQPQTGAAEPAEEEGQNK